MITSRTITRAALAILLALAPASAASAQGKPPKAAPSQPTTLKVDGNLTKSYIAYLASNDTLGRKSLTPGYEKVADWAAGKFKQWGLKPAGENGTYFQSVPVTGPRSSFAFSLGVPELSIAGRKFSLSDNDFTLDSASTPATAADADVVFVGYGISAPDKGLDEYAGVDVKGKVVLVMKGSPKDAPAAPQMFGPPPGRGAQAEPAEDPWKEHATDSAKIKTAYDKGAAAILLCTPPASAPLFGGPAAPAAPAIVVSMGQRPGALEPSPYTRPFLVLSNVDERVFRWVMLRDPQETLRGFNARVGQIRRDIKEKKPRSFNTGLTAHLKGYDSVTLYGEKFNNNVTRNVLAKIEGVDPALKNQYIVIGGHLDHLGVTNGVIFNGADDDASGSAVTLEVARVMGTGLVRPKRTIIFALWAAEELGLLGSNHYTKNPCDGVSMDRVVTNFNLDMVGLGSQIGVPGSLNFPAIFDVIMRNQDPEIAKILVEREATGPGGSDYSGFIERGIEALALMTAGGVGHPDYHDSGDDAEKMDPDILAKTGQFVLQGALNVANETRVNLIIPDRQVIYNAQRFAPPDLTAGMRGWTTLKATSPAELLALVDARVKQLRTPTPMTGIVVRRGMRGGPGLGRVGTGVDVSAFGGSVALLQTSFDALQFGRVDVAKDDGAWFSNGVTEQGREALKAMEANGIPINLVSPSPKLLDDVLAVATKPFLVTGLASIDPGAAAKLHAVKALVAIQCDVADPAECVTTLGAAKKAFGDVDNLVLTMKGVAESENEATKLKWEQAKEAVYLALAKAGWTQDELTVMVSTTPAIPGMTERPAGNLTRLNPAMRVSF
jgi:Peptidase family M28